MFTMNDSLPSFEEAFRDMSIGCRRTCECGRVFYDTFNDWDWDEGEVESLRASGATPVGYSISTVIFEGKEFCVDCDCWHDRAEKLISWINGHKCEIAKYLNLEKKRKQAVADAAPTVP